MTPRIKIKVDEARREVFVNGKDVYLCPKEFSIVALLVREPNKAHSREEIGTELGYDQAYIELGSRVIDQHVARARRKIGPGVIETVARYGYRLA